jgi:hypothetical protein
VKVNYVPFNGSGSSVLPPNQFMTPGQFLVSPNGRFVLALQADGNLVIKDNRVVVWVANRDQPYSLTLAGNRLTDVRFYVSNSAFLHDVHGRRKWIAESSHSRDKSLWFHSHLSIQDDGNMVIYDNRNGDLCWARFGFVPSRAKKKLVPVYGPYTVYKWRF